MSEKQIPAGDVGSPSPAGAEHCALSIPGGLGAASPRRSLPARVPASCHPAESLAGSAVAPCCWDVTAANHCEVRRKREKEAQDVGFVLLQLYSLAHTQESQLVLMGIFRGLSWKPWDSDSSVAWGILGVPKLIIRLPCLEGSCQNKNLLTTISTETLGLYGAFWGHLLWHL